MLHPAEYGVANLQRARDARGYGVGGARRVQIDPRCGAPAPKGGVTGGVGYPNVSDLVCSIDAVGDRGDISRRVQVYPAGRAAAPKGGALDSTVGDDVAHLLAAFHAVGNGRVRVPRHWIGRRVEIDPGSSGAAPERGVVIPDVRVSNLLSAAGGEDARVVGPNRMQIDPRARCAAPDAGAREAIGVDLTGLDGTVTGVTDRVDGPSGMEVHERCCSSGPPCATEVAHRRPQLRVADLLVAAAAVGSG